MPGKVRSIERGGIQLSEPVRAQVEYLARLAGVGPADIVNFVLSEMLETDSAEPVPAPPVRRRARSHPSVAHRRAADVIPINRKRIAVAPAGMVKDYRDVRYLRRQADEIRGRAREVRARAARMCGAARDARERARDLLDAAAGRR
jgi:hypothetical protein